MKLGTAQHYRQYLQELIAVYKGQYGAVSEGYVTWSTSDIDEVKKMYEIPLTYGSREKRYIIAFIEKVEPDDLDPEGYDAYNSLV